MAWIKSENFTTYPPSHKATEGRGKGGKNPFVWTDNKEKLLPGWERV